MPDGADPARYIAAGPWCFGGREELFPDFAKKYSFCPEPLADPDLLPEAALAAETLCAKAIPWIAGSLSANSGEFKPVYWQTLLAPWAIAVASQIVERAYRCRAMREVYGNEKLRVPLLPVETVFNFIDEDDFYIRGALGSDFNFWLFSRLLELDWPKNWEKIFLTAPEAADMPSGRRPPPRIVKNFLRSLSLKLLFPPLKGVSFVQALKYSLAMRRSRRRKDHSEDLAKTYVFSEGLQKLELGENIFYIFQRALPGSIKKLAHSSPVGSMKKSLPRIASIIAYENSAYRQDLALWRQSGGKLAWIQHGGNYGMIKTACNSQIVEYSQDAFFTWGWTKGGAAKGNFIPMPYPGLAKIADKWSPGKNGDILFVGAEMALYGYRLESRPTPLQFLKYREYKCEFLEELGGDLLKRVLYRPYFSLPGTLEDYAWLERRFPGLRLCEGPLASRLRDCALLILDHHGTTMLEALAMGTPTLLYWNPAQWPLSPEGERARRVMKDAGIWYDNPRDAARFAKKILPDPAAWHRSTLAARRELRERLAMLPKGDIDKIWISTLKNL